jgi:serine/threonine protein phosphatase PrpC
VTARPQPIVAADLTPIAWSAARTHIGVVRALNEDAYLDSARIGLWAVADGMGGHQAGDVASQATIEALAAIPAAASGYALLGAVQAALQQTNRRLLAEASLIGPGAIIGSTVVVLLIRDGHFACLWAGDSRAYRWRDRGLEVVTHDHSVAQEMIDRGEITPADARSHAHANLITRALGVAEPLQPDLINGAIEPGDVFLLCSDGLTGAVPDEEIAEILAAHPLDSAADALVARALEHGAKDNLTLVLVQPK